MFVPGLGLLALDAAVDRLAPPLDQQEGVYLQSLLELVAGVLGIPAAQIDSPDFSSLFDLFTNPGEQTRELAAALQALAGDSDAGGAAAAVAADVADAVAATLAARAGVPVDTLFPLRAPVLQRVRAGLPTPPQSAVSSMASVESSVDDDGSGFMGGGPSSSGTGARPAAVQPAAAAASSGSSRKGVVPQVAMRMLSTLEEEEEEERRKQQQETPVRR